MNEAPRSPISETEPLIEISDALPGDVQGMCEVQEGRTVDTESRDGAQLAEKGFLVYQITPDEFRQIVQDQSNHLIKVAKAGSELIGYLASYNLDSWRDSHPHWLSEINAPDDVKTILSDRRVMYGRHVAVNENRATKGVGGKLLDQTLQDAEKLGYEFYVVEILRDPIENKRSESFVTKKGFSQVGDRKDENDRVWMIFLKKLGGENLI